MTPVPTQTAKHVIHSSKLNGAPAILSLCASVVGSGTGLGWITEKVSVRTPVVNVVMPSRSSVVQ